MKHLLALIFLLFLSYAMPAQVGTNGMQGTSFWNGDFLLSNLKDVKTESILNPVVYSDIEGSAYLFDEWALSKLMLADGRKFDSVLLRINLYENRVEFKDENGNPKLLAGALKAIQVIDSSSKYVGSWFLSDLEVDRNAIYKVVTGGKNAALLKKVKTVIRESKEHNAPPKKSFEKVEELYVQLSGRLYVATKNGSNTALIFDVDESIRNFISSNNIKCSKESDLIKLINHLNKN